MLFWPVGASIDLSINMNLINIIHPSIIEIGNDVIPVIYLDCVCVCVLLEIAVSIISKIYQQSICNTFAQHSLFGAKKSTAKRANFLSDFRFEQSPFLKEKKPLGRKKNP